MRAVYHVALLGLVLALVPTSAQAETKTYKSWGVGNNSCSVWTRMRSDASKSGEVSKLRSWMQGFLSGYNAYGRGGGNITRGMEVDDFHSWVDSFCKDHPDEILADVMETFRRKDKPVGSTEADIAKVPVLMRRRALL